MESEQGFHSRQGADAIPAGSPGPSAAGRTRCSDLVAVTEAGSAGGSDGYSLGMRATADGAGGPRAPRPMISAVLGSSDRGGQRNSTPGPAVAWGYASTLAWTLARGGAAPCWLVSPYLAEGHRGTVGTSASFGESRQLRFEGRIDDSGLAGECRSAVTGSAA